MSEYTDNPYATLGVDPTATEAEVKKAYRKLALKFHPDRHTDAKAKEEATTKFAAIANAYEILSDEHLRSEYDRSQHESVSTNNDTKKKSKKNKKGASANEEPPPFHYHFSDPYEVFKRDFRDQFGIEYPGAQYDWVDFDQPLHKGPPAKSTMLIGNGETSTAAVPKKKRSFNPFRRKNKTAQLKEEAKTPGGKANTDDGALVPYKAPDTLAKSASSDQSGALVRTDKRNNRPVSMDVETSKAGQVTTTKMTITRPDGTVETVTMKTGIPGKAPGSVNPKLALTNGPEHKALPPTTNKKEVRKLTNGVEPKRKLLGWK